MKKLISLLSLVFVLATLSANAQCCSKSASAKQESKTTVNDPSQSTVQAYYFHATRRCATCKAVEMVTKDAVKAYSADKVYFQSINRDEEKDNPLIAKYNISGQSLLIIKGNKVENLTNYAFMNARTKPERLKAKIASTIDSML